MLILKRNGQVISMRGARGGYALARHPADISLSEVFTVLEGSEALIYGADSPSRCPRSNHCATHDLLEFLNETMLSALSPLTLESMAKRQSLKQELD